MRNKTSMAVKVEDADPVTVDPQDLVMGKRHVPCKGKKGDLKTAARKLGFNIQEREQLHRLYVDLIEKAEGEN